MNAASVNPAISAPGVSSYYTQDKFLIGAGIGLFFGVISFCKKL